ncbi:MAG: LL-diaminopimelate aminotransferase [Anaerolineaceae bacterium]|nr:LL-diaminopimelate aminotransferase [Anaerolineaceae bacterium]
MTENNIVIEPAHRIAAFKPYFFASLAKNISELKEKGIDVIRIDMGSPDLPPEDFIIDKLASAAKNKNAHGYTANGGTPAFRLAISNYYKRRFNVILDPATETLGLIGSKEGLFHLAQVLINPGDLVIIPDPGYPVYSASTKIAGGEIYTLPLRAENKFLPDLNEIPENIAKRAKLIWINYPNNPTGATADLSFFETIVDFALKHNIFIAHDAPYVDICFNDYIAPSILQIPEAKNISIEFNSLSKTYNMAGWRLGMAVGNKDVIKLIHTYKSQLDSSHFGPIMEAGIVAMEGDQTWLSKRNQVYEKRRDIVVKGLREVGFELNIPPAAIYVWAKLPQPFTDSYKFCADLLNETGVSTTPGDVYGNFGKGYIRISLGTETSKIEEAINRLRTWIKQ